MNVMAQITRSNQLAAPLAARRAVLRSARSSGRETAGAYMRRCRERAGLSIEDCAAKIAGPQNERCHARNDLELLEDDRPGNYYRLARSLNDHRVFGFSISVFLSLTSATADAGLEEWPNGEGPGA